MKIRDTQALNCLSLASLYNEAGWLLLGCDERKPNAFSQVILKASVLNPHSGSQSQYRAACEDKIFPFYHSTDLYTEESTWTVFLHQSHLGTSMRLPPSIPGSHLLLRLTRACISCE